jgi:hypothetical protein
MASKIKEEILKEIKKTARVTDHSSMQFKILDNLYANIKKLDDDKDIHNLIWANRELPLRMLTNEDFKLMPKVAGILTGNADTDTIDLDKDFGKDWYNEYEQIPLSKIQFIADKYGRDANDLINYMQTEAVNKRRQEIADDLIAHLVAPRSTEAIQRGESPSNKDVAIDIAQNAAYAIPWARGAQAVTKGAGRLYKVLSNPFVQGTLSNVTAPLTTEVADAAAYDESNPRGNFNVGDVAAGAGVNLVGGSLIRGAGAGINRVSPTVGRYLNTLGQGKTASEVADNVMKDYVGFNLANVNKANISSETRQLANKMKQMYSTDYNSYAALAPEDKALIWQIARQDGATLEDKVRNYMKQYSKYPDKVAAINDINSEMYMSSPEMLQRQLKKVGFEGDATANIPISKNVIDVYDKLGLGRTEIRPGTDVKSTADLLKEESLKNYITNQFGTARDEQGKALTRIPIVGIYIQKYLDEKAKEEAEQRKLDEIMRKYNINLGVK